MTQRVKIDPLAPSSSIGKPVQAETLSPGAEAERRRIRRGLKVMAAVVLFGFFGLLRYDYPAVRALDGRSFLLVDQGSYAGTDWSGAYMRFLTTADELEAIKHDVAVMLPVAARFAETQGKAELQLSAIRRKFRYGLFSIDASYHVRFRRIGDSWVAR